MKPKRIVIIGTDYPAYELACPHWRGIRSGLTRLGIPYLFVSCRPTLDLGQILAFQPDLVVYCLKDMVVHKDWRVEIREKLPNAVIVLWYGDFRDKRSLQIDADCSELDALFISNDAQEEFYQRKWKVKKVHFLPLGCEPIPSPVYNKKYAFPFVFIGSQISGSGFHERAAFIERCRMEAGLVLINSFGLRMRERIFKEMPSIYSSSKVCLDVSHFTDVLQYTSIRFWEVPAFWGFALTKRWPGCEEYYPENTRAYFDTFEEMVYKKNYYLEHEDERKEMVARAHKLSYSQTYDHRFTQMFSVL